MLVYVLGVYCLLRNLIVCALTSIAVLLSGCADDGLDPDSGMRADVRMSSSRPDGAADDSGQATDAEPMVDSGQMDAAAAQDAEPPDTGVHEDASIPDVITAMDADSPPDASSALDASTFPDAALTCGSIGNSCASDTDCAGLSCKLPQGICMPNVIETCGGFAGAQCPAVIPECHYYTGADYGPCFTAFEKNCVCSSAARLVVIGCP